MVVRSCNDVFGNSSLPIEVAPALVDMPVSPKLLRRCCTCCVCENATLGLVALAEAATSQVAVQLNSMCDPSVQDVLHAPAQSNSTVVASSAAGDD
eukprot:CAMPEP_0169393778 /NCGR_PEP_ID=MMETSP1017-20121227/49601_1 /TAXON_ID=342587 /ORGANISM="Karlodinium micrum, Strain CCMP2283" /LENGTH=95 /DNA_ID=CAMNT_0009497343 /DNA_START=70 /DNA_END=358 /DNA_ORIENTATION=+